MRLHNIRGVGLLLTLAAGFVVIACYNPDIQTGKLMCNPGGGKLCPDGFDCVANRCVETTGAGVPGVGGSPGTGGTIGAGGGSASGGAGGLCAGPVPACAARQATKGACEEVCQTGCACNERCTASDTLGQVTCQPDLGGRQKVGDVCQGTTFQDDNCEPGSVCLTDLEEVEACGRHCFRFCTRDADCANGARCTGSITLTKPGETVAQQSDNNSLQICDVPPDDCSPIHGAGKCKRPDRASGPFGCYVASVEHASEKVCDCAGLKEEDQECAHGRDCKPGMFCALQGNTFLCKRVCPREQPVVAKTICGLGKSCMPINSEKPGPWGVCL